MVHVHVHVTLRSSILDPQGQAIGRALQQLGMDGVASVRTGKIIELSIDTDDPVEAEAVAREAAEKLLANPVTERFVVTSVLAPATA